MRFAYVNLGEQEKGARVLAHLQGSSANVILLDWPNFNRYRSNRPFIYSGGIQWRSPVELEVPEDGEWFVVVDLAGYRGSVHGRLELVRDGEVAHLASVHVS